VQQGVPSRTARAAAMHRAVHQVLDAGRIFCDPLALRILGQDAETISAAAAREEPWRRALRFFIAARTRFAEDALASAVERGVRQLIVLGAGLDTFAYRNPHPDLRVFEVDHPSTQAWKRELLASAAIHAPSSLVFAPLDFERQDLSEALFAVGLDASVPTFVSWLGVVVYLSPAITWSTLRFIASLAGGSQVVFDYTNPLAEVAPAARGTVVAGAERVAAVGEAWINFFDTAQLHRELGALGFPALEDLGPAAIVARYVPSEPLPVSDNGPHFIHVTR